jgi:thiol peroxidase
MLIIMPFQQSDSRLPSRKQNEMPKKGACIHLNKSNHFLLKTLCLGCISCLMFSFSSCKIKPEQQNVENNKQAADAVNNKNLNKNLSQKNTTFMTTIQFKGNPIHTVGALPQTGTQAPDFTLVNGELAEKSLSDYKGKFVILNIFPSVNTGVCAASVREFNKDAASIDNATVLCISKDLPFAQSQFCGAEGINNVTMLSDFRTDFGHQYGVQMADGPLQGLLSRAVVVINPEGKIIYEQQVPEITEEPNYEKALAAIQ